MEQALTTAPVTQIEQKEAVYQLALEVLGAAANNPASPLKTLVTKEVRKAIRVKLFEGIRAGTIEFKPNKTDGELKKYCSSLINNWLKKDPRFN
jgi:hypothetical protein